jgi:hypothetical protein
MPTAGRSWDLAGRLCVRAEGLDDPQDRAMCRQMDPFVPTTGHADADVVLAPLTPSAVEELQGPAMDRRTTARDHEGRLLARYGTSWAEVPAPGRASFRIGLEPGLLLHDCWAHLVRPALHQALRHRHAVAVHAAAVDGGVTGGTLVSGWSESGKTEVALALVEAGASFLSDKWTVAGEDGQISAFPVGVGVRGWVLESLPRLKAGLPRRARAQLLAARAARADWAAQRLARTAAYERRNYYDLQDRGAYAGLPDRARAREEALDAEELSLARVLAGSVRVLRVTCPFPGDPRRVVDAVAAHR